MLLTSSYHIDRPNDKGSRFGHHCCPRTSPNLIKIEVNITKLIIKSINSFTPIRVRAGK